MITNRTIKISLFFFFFLDDPKIGFWTCVERADWLTCPAAASGRRGPRCSRSLAQGSWGCSVWYAWWSFPPPCTPPRSGSHTGWPAHTHTTQRDLGWTCTGYVYVGSLEGVTLPEKLCFCAVGLTWAILRKQNDKGSTKLKDPPGFCLYSVDYMRTAHLSSIHLHQFCTKMHCVYYSHPHILTQELQKFGLWTSVEQSWFQRMEQRLFRGNTKQDYPVCPEQFRANLWPEKSIWEKNWSIISFDFNQSSLTIFHE